MRFINMATMEVVHSGKEWEYEVTPCSKSAISLLERNEAVVTWIKPIGGSVNEQIPTIRYKNKHWTLSLRMMKVEAPCNRLPVLHAMEA